MNERPLSPHLQVYRLPLTAKLSILHRASGVLLYLGTVLLALMLMAVAQGPDGFALSQSLLGSVLGKLFLWGWIFALFFHLCHGVRHLLWDTGHGFERETLGRFARYEIAVSLALTAGVLVLSKFWG
ncbi:MAG: succinate dehydrogenase, cytochrome b556 subunit [Methylococcaceae bacterium]|nr:succinate dehydrogenase, cytochrome b556 subunit [Methylococcaceae bacterium]